MTADEREASIISMLDVLTLYPADMVKLVDFVNANDADWAGDTAISSATFLEEKCPRN